MVKNILYIGNFEFPNGNAAGKRVYANGKILKSLGYNVIFLGMEKREEDNLVSLKNSKKEFDGFTSYSFAYPSNNFQWIKYKKRFKEMKTLLKSENLLMDLDMVITYGSPAISIFNDLLIQYCKKNTISIVSDCVDWLTVKTNNPLFDIVKWTDNRFQKAYLNKKVDGIIAISTYLSNYYKTSEMNVIIIPPLATSDISNRPLELELNEMTTLTYAGIPFRQGQIISDLNSLKDRIDKTIIWLYQSKLRNHKFIFNIYGFTKEEYLYSIPQQTKYVDGLGESIVFHGKLENDQVSKKISRSDFTILIRDVNRDTTAGFPTKVSESISCGTPVITTKTSDLDKYIIEGKNGFFIENENDENIASFFDNIFSLKKSEIIKIKKTCVESKIFYYSNFEKEMGIFIKKVHSS